MGWGLQEGRFDEHPRGQKTKTRPRANRHGYRRSIPTKLLRSRWAFSRRRVSQSQIGGARTAEPSVPEDIRTTNMELVSKEQPQINEEEQWRESDLFELMRQVTLAWD